MASGDFDGDGTDDLAIGVPDEDVSGGTNGGAVHIIYGTGEGLSATNDEFLTQNTSGVPGEPGSSDRFGFALMAGNFNNDGFTDLAIGIPGERLNSNSGAGGVNIAYGETDGFGAAVHQFWSQNAGGIPDGSEPGDHFGSALGAAPLDLNGL